MNFRKNPFRDNTCKFKEKSAFKIVADPFAGEEEWLAAALSLPPATQSSTRNSIVAQAKRLSTLKNSVAIVTITVSMVLLVQAGYDFGFKVVESLFQQNEDCAQGVVAQFSLMHIVYPITLAILFATRVRLRSALNNNLLLLLSAAGVIAYDSLLNQDIFYRAGAVVFTAVCAQATFVVMNLSRFRFRISELRTPELWNVPVLASLLTCALVCTYVSGEERYFIPVQILCYGTALGLVTLLCKTKSGSSKAGSSKAGLQPSLLVLLPIIVCNALNIILNVISLILDKFGVGAGLGWRALVSAILINVVAFAAITIGAKLPLGSRKRIGRRQSPVIIS